MCVIKIYSSYFSTKTYVVGTQKNRFNETPVIYVKTDIQNFTIKHFVHLNLLLSLLCGVCTTFIGFPVTGHEDTEMRENKYSKT